MTGNKIFVDAFAKSFQGESHKRNDNKFRREVKIVLFFVVDVSGSMAGEKIGVVNALIREVLNDMDFEEAGGANADIFVAALSFSNGCEWITPQPIPIREMRWHDLESSGGTDLGAACRALSKKLDKKEFLDAPGDSAVPVILLFSDGAPTDDFEAGLAELEANKYYKQCKRFPCAIGKYADKRVLAEFCGILVDFVPSVYVPGESGEFLSWIISSGDLLQWITQWITSIVNELIVGDTSVAQENAIEDVRQAIENDEVLKDQETAPDDWE